MEPSTNMTDDRPFSMYLTEAIFPSGSRFRMIGRHMIAVVSVMFTVYTVLSSAASAGLNDETLHAHVRADSSLFEDNGTTDLTLEGGPLGILMIGRYDRVGELAAELHAHIGCRIDAVYTESETKLGGNPDYPDAVPDEIVIRHIEDLLDREWQAVWLDFNPGSLPESILTKLIESIRRGTGLVFVGDKTPLDRYLGKSGIGNNPSDAVTFTDSKAEIAGVIGDGLVVTMTQHDYSLVERLNGNYSLAAVNALLVASRRDTGLFVRKIEQQRRLEFEGLHFSSFRLDMINDNPADTMNVTCRYRNDSGDIAAEISQDFIVEKGKTFVMLDFPLLPIGDYSTDIFISGDKGIKAVAGSSFSVTASPRITAIDLWSPFVRENGILAGTVRFSAEFEESVSMSADVIDEYGRILSETNLEVTPKRMMLPFSFLVKSANGRIVKLRVMYYKSYELVQVAERIVYVTKAYDPSKFSVVVGPCDFIIPQNPSKFRKLAANGITAFSAGISGLTSGTLFQRVMKYKVDGLNYIPLYNNPFYIDSEYDNTDEPVDFIIGSVDTLRHFLPPSYMARFGYGSDIAHTSEDNPSGGTTGSHDDSLPTVIGDMLSLEKNLFSSHKRLRESIARSDSSAHVGLFDYPSGMAALSVFNPYRWKDIVTSYATLPAFSRDDDAEYVLNALVSSLSVTGGLKCTIIGGDMKRMNEACYHASPWMALFDGMNGLWWSTGDSRVYSPLTPDRMLSPALSIVTEETAEITGGIDLLLSESERKTDEFIGIFYSPLAVAESALSGNNDRNFSVDSTASFHRALRDAGYTPVFVTGEQLAGSHGKQSGRILILPHMRALTINDAESVRRFVESGGTVIADIRPGVIDERFKSRETGILDDLFGVKVTVTHTTALSEGSLQIRENDVFPLIEGAIDVCRAESGITVTGEAHSLGTIGEIPAVIVNDHGDGRAVLMNVSVAGYYSMRYENRGSDMRDLINALVSSFSRDREHSVSAGVFDTNGNRVQAATTTVFTDGGITYIGVIADPFITSQHREAYLKIAGAGGPQPVYNVRKGEFSGVVDTIPVEIIPGRAGLFAILPYRVRRLEIGMEDTIIKTGGQFSFRVSVDTGNVTDQVGRHVFRTEVFDPDGFECRYFRTIADGKGGVYDGTLFIARNEKPGRWRLKVTDIATGKSSERTFMVMPPAGK